MEEEPEPLKQGTGSKIIGAILVATGVVTCFVALKLKTAVEQSPTYSPYSPTTEPSAILNIGLLQEQMMVWHAGLALCLAGAIGLFTGALIKAIKH